MHSRQFATAVLLLAAPFARALAYEKAQIHNRTPFAGTVAISYSGCRGDTFRVGAGRLDEKGVIQEAINHAPSTRGGCLIRKIHVTLEGAPRGVIDYTSSGTSYFQFTIVPGASEFQIISNASVGEARPTMTGSPGFEITNKTGWIVNVGLANVGCPHGGSILPGQTLSLTTAAAWFTISARMQPERRGEFRCGTGAPTEEAAFLMRTATNDPNTFSGIPSGGRNTAGASVTAANAVAVRYLVNPSPSAPPITVTTVMGGLSATNSVSLARQYSGGDWPYRCDTKPAYEITGGWGPAGTQTRADGSVFVVDPGTAMVIRRVRACGGGVM